MDSSAGPDVSGRFHGMEEVIGSPDSYRDDILHKALKQRTFFLSYFVYILYSKKVDRYYVGETDNIGSRVKSHRDGISRYTLIADDWVLVYSESFATRREAIQRERAIKRMKSRKYIERLIDG